MTTYRATLICKGLTDAEGAAAVDDILEEFRARPWHTDVSCAWLDGSLRLSASNDYDHDGMALLDEYWDAIHICINYTSAINVSVVEVTKQG